MQSSGRSCAATAMIPPPAPWRCSLHSLVCRHRRLLRGRPDAGTAHPPGDRLVVNGGLLIVAVVLAAIWTRPQANLTPDARDV
jgi:hypothetical protein